MFRTFEQFVIQNYKYTSEYILKGYSKYDSLPDKEVPYYIASARRAYNIEDGRFLAALAFSALALILVFVFGVFVPETQASWAWLVLSLVGVVFTFIFGREKTKKAFLYAQALLRGLNT